MSDPPVVGSRRTSIIRLSIVIGVVVVVGSVVALLAFRDDGASDDATPGAAALAVSRLDESDGRAYIGSIGDATDAVRLRRALRAEFRSTQPRPRDSDRSTRARRCATDLQRASEGRAGRVVYLADATLSGEPAVVIGITDRGRVVAFVADAETCEVRTAQSL